MGKNTMQVHNVFPVSLYYYYYYLLFITKVSGVNDIHSLMFYCKRHYFFFFRFVINLKRENIKPSWVHGSDSP